MQMDKQFLRMHLDYTFWATQRLLDALQSVPADELQRDCGNSHGGIMDTLLHIYYADRIWLSRTTEHPRSTLADAGETWSLEALNEAWREVADGWRRWADGLEDVRASLQYRNLLGQAHSVELWEMVMHLVNHATYHRGQITTMLRQCGQKPVSTDFHVYRQSLRS